MFNPETDVSHTVALLRRLGIEGRSVPLALKDRHVGWDRQLTLRMAVHNSVRRHQSKRRHRNRHGQHEDHGSGIGHLPHDRHPSTRVTRQKFPLVHPEKETLAHCDAKVKRGSAVPITSSDACRAQGIKNAAGALSCRGVLAICPAGAQSRRWRPSRTLQLLH